MGNNPINFNDPSGEFANFLLGGAANVAIGYGISWATGQDYSWGNAAVDFGIGAATSGVSAANVIHRFSQMSSIEKGALGVRMAEQRIASRGESVIGREIVVATPVARPRADLIVDASTGLRGVEAKLGPSATLSKAQIEGYGYINNGGTGVLTGKAATGAGIAGQTVSNVELMHFYKNGYDTMRNVMPNALKMDLGFQAFMHGADAKAGK